jgi:hypothetical protein
MTTPTTRYVRTRDGVDIAYQVTGDGPDLLCVPQILSHLEYELEFEDRGEHELKGVPGRWQLYAVKS